MAGDRDKTPITEIRRRDRTQDEDWIRAFLHAGAWGTRATVSEGQPFINTNLYVYDEPKHTIYLHGARIGRTRSNIEAGGPVCFNVSEMGRILPDDVALEFSVEYAGVTVFGRCAVVDDEDEGYRGLQMLMDKYAPQLQPGRDYRPASREDLDRTSVYRIDIEAWSGKMNEKETDFPGAYRYERFRKPSPFSSAGTR
ncbi:MAG: hypothetical protein AMS21_05245 [Gemmatimonas sp. SG8_38_2]|nr:MAG: hypothetical protein AMS21_05245 [Gemmatimonas sp. SG8_38_2]